MKPQLPTDSLIARVLSGIAAAVIAAALFAGVLVGMTSPTGEFHLLVATVGLTPR